MKKEEILTHATSLLEKGKSLANNIGRHKYGTEHWFSEQQIPDLQAFISSAAHLIKSSTSESDFYSKECNRIMSHSDFETGVSYPVFNRFIGHFSSFLNALEEGILSSVEYIFVSATFDDFLDHAEKFHKSNKKIEAAILASSVFEDTMRKLAEKNGVDRKKKMDQIIDSIDAFTPIKRKQIKAYAGVRNDALHADYDNFDIKDVGRLINGTRELIGEYLT